MRPIDADEALAGVKPYEPSDEMWNCTGGTAIRLIHNAIDNAPTLDVVPVPELLELRDELYETDRITMNGLKLLNHLIAKYSCGRSNDWVQAVRCRGCVYRDGTPGQPNIICHQMHDDDYCSYGTLKEKGEHDGESD